MICKGKGMLCALGIIGEMKIPSISRDQKKNENPAELTLI